MGSDMVSYYKYSNSTSSKLIGGNGRGTPMDPLILTTSFKLIGEK